MTDLDDTLRAAMRTARRPIDTRPSLSDVRRRARRRNRRRMTAVAGSLGVLGVAATGLALRREGPSHQLSLDDGTDVPSTTLNFDSMPTTTLGVMESSPITITPTMVWDALGAIGIHPADETAAAAMPTPEQTGCTGDACRPMFAYVVWNEIARSLGFGDAQSLASANPNLDLATPPVDGQTLQMGGFVPVPTTVIVGTAPATTVLSETAPATTAPASEGEGGATTTTNVSFDGVILIDAGAPSGAMDDVYERLAGFNRTIVPGSGKTTDRTLVMVITNAQLAAAVAPVLNVSGVDPWDPSFLGSAVFGRAAVVIGPDYWDLVGNAVAPTSTTSIAP
jgi:hypothetical protein